MAVWKYDFAPHDAGTYPHCCGHVYGFNHAENKFLGNLIQKNNKETWFPFYLLPADYDVYDLKDQMPVEECANLLIMQYACFSRDGGYIFLCGEFRFGGKVGGISYKIWFETRGTTFAPTTLRGI